MSFGSSAHVPHPNYLLNNGVVKQYGLITDVQAVISRIKIGAIVYIEERDANFECVAYTASDDGYGILVGDGATKSLSVIISGVTSTIAFGGTGLAGENLAAILPKMYAFGVRRFYIPNTTCIMGNVDLTDSDVTGNGCVITSGSIQNAKLVGVTHLNTNKFDSVASCPQLSSSVRSKLVYRFADVGSQKNVGVCTKSASGDGYVWHNYNDNVGDAAGATSIGPPHGLFRSVYAAPASNCVLLKQGFSAQSASHAKTTNIEFAINSSAKTVNMINSDGTTTSNFIKAYTIPTSGWQEHTITLAAGEESSRKCNVAIYSSNTVSQDFTVEVGGITVFSGSASKRGTEHGIWTIDFELTNSATATDSVHTIRITNNSVVAPLYLVGVNYYALEDVPHPGTEFDMWKIWVDLTNPFINLMGASDYAIYDDDAALWVGSYHGGEVSNSLAMSVDGVEYDFTAFAAGDFLVGHSVSFTQETIINSKLDTYSSTSHHADGVQSFKAVMSGSINCGTFYTMLCPTYWEYDYVVFPEYVANGIAGALQNLGDNNDVIQKRTSTGQYVRNVFTKFDNSKNSRGGLYQDNKEGSPGVVSNRKVYYGPVVSSFATVEKIGFEVQREFGSGKY